MIIKIFATSDIHGRIYPYDYVNQKKLTHSLSHIDSAYTKLKNENSILVDNGDLIQGNFIETLLEDELLPKTLNTMGYDIFNMGNHEFNFGLSTLKNILKNINATPLMANSNDNFFAPYKIIKKGNIKLAFIGINTILVNQFENPLFLEGLKIFDPIKILDKLILKLKNEVDGIILMAHLGLKDENSINHAGIYSIVDDLKYSKYIDVIIAGHLHETININYKGILITEPSYYGEYLSQIDLEFNENKLINKSVKLIDVKNFIPSNRINDLYKDAHKKIIKKTNEIIGTIKNSNPNDYNFNDGALAHLLTEIMLSYKYCDVVSFQLADEVILREEITKSDFARLSTYAGAEVTRYEITGKDLKEYMKWSYNYFTINDYGEIIKNPNRQNFKYKTLDIFGNIKYKIKISDSIEILELKYKNGNDIHDDDKLIIGMNEYRMNYLISQNGPLSNKKFKKLDSSKYVGKDFKKHGTIRELAKEYFNSLDNKTFIYNNTKLYTVI